MIPESGTIERLYPTRQGCGQNLGPGPWATLWATLWATPQVFFSIKIKNNKHKKNKLKINFLLIYQLLIF